MKEKEVYGKLKLDACTILEPSKKNIDADVYIHLKGYARARVSHIDVEKIGLGKLIRRGRGNFLKHFFMHDNIIEWGGSSFPESPVDVSGPGCNDKCSNKPGGGGILDCC